MASSAERQKQFRNRMRDNGFEAVTVWVPAAQAAQLTIIAKAMMANPKLELGNTLKNPETGRFVKVA